MSNPSTSIIICNVPWDDTYRHLRLFSSVTEQRNFFTIRAKYSLIRYSYIRENGNLVLKVPIEAEDLHDCNYVCYKNGDDWHYCFITNIRYLAEGTSAIDFVEDWYQTWMFNMEIKPCFIVREHVASDGIGEHTVAEGIDPGAQISTVSISVLAAKNHYYLYATNISLTTWASLGDIGYGRARWKNPGDSGNEYSGCYVLDIGTDISGIDSIVDCFATHGQLDSVVGVYNLPESQELSRDIMRPSVLGGYAPKNNKLLTYPYLYFTVTSAGQSVEYAWEDFNGTPNFKANLPFVPGASGFYYPTNYKKRSTASKDDPNYVVVLSDAFQPGWRGNSFANYIANHGLSTSLGILSGEVALMSAIGSLPAVAAGASTALTVPTAVAGAAGIAAASAAAPAIGIGAGLLALGGAKSMASNLERLTAAVRNSNKVEATQSCSAITNRYGFAIFINAICSKPEFLEIVDNYFTVYGYKVNRLGAVNITSRPSWNYVQTDNSVVVGTNGGAPADAIRNFANVLDRGVTFWHTNDVGNYSLNNSLGR